MAALIFWTVLGGLVGGFAKSVFWFESSKGWLACVIFGAAGGIAGGSVLGAAYAFELSGMGAAIAGSTVVLSVYALFARRAQVARVAGRRAA